MERQFLTPRSQNMTLIRALMSKLLFGVRDSDHIKNSQESGLSLGSKSLAPIWLEFPLSHTKNFAGLCAENDVVCVSWARAQVIRSCALAADLWARWQSAVPFVRLSNQLSSSQLRRRRATVFLSWREWDALRGVLRSSLSGVSCGTEAALVRRPTTPGRTNGRHMCSAGSGCALTSPRAQPSFLSVQLMRAPRRDGIT